MLQNLALMSVVLKLKNLALLSAVSWVVVAVMTVVFFVSPLGLLLAGGQVYLFPAVPFYSVKCPCERLP